VKQIGIKEAVNKTLLSVTSLEKKEEDPMEHQVTKLSEAIQELHQRITNLELQTVSSTPQDV
jgi:prefoldin subunit 5